MRSLINYLIAISFTLIFSSAQASLTLDATRVIFKAQDKETSLVVRNKDDKPALVQVWLEGETAADDNVPFAISPSLAKITANGRQVLRILNADDSLPKNRESLFWLNVQHIPQKAKGTNNASQLQIAVRQRIKMFYRPSGLAGKVEDAPQQLKWSMSTKGGNKIVSVNNPTPYYVSFHQLTVKENASSKGHQLVESGMIAPGATKEFKAPNRPFKQVNFININDFGGDVPVTANL